MMLLHQDNTDENAFFNMLDSSLEMMQQKWNSGNLW